jgi:hydrogenase nickel incorporation protein HypA/HybF
MHELYLAECILKSAREALPPDCEPRSVERIYVRVGKLDAVVPESLSFLFNAIRSEHDMPDAVLEIIEEEVQCECQSCDRTFEVSFPSFVCPHCGGGDLKILRGRGLIVERLIIQDEVRHGDPCRT